METFLQISGGVFLALIFLILIVFLFLWFKWKTFRKYFSVADIPTPSRIHLIPDISPDWIEEEAADNAMSAFRDLGFSDVGAFKIKEMRLVQLFAFVHEREHLMAVVYRQKNIGVWSDVCLEYENGNSLTVSNAPMGGELDIRPGSLKIADKTLNEIELVERIVKERESDNYRPVSVGSFSIRFEESYAEDMDWRNQRGGPTKDEIRRVAENMNFEFSEDQIDEAYLESIETTMGRLNEECVGQFIETTDISVAKWESVRDDIFTVHEKIPHKLLLEYLKDYADLPEDQWKRLDSLIDVNMQVTELFALMNERLPHELRFEKLGAISEPVKAEIYAAPTDES